MKIKINEIIRTNRKTIAIIVEYDGRLVVRAPLRVSDKDIFRLVHKKEKWIRRKQEQVRHQYPRVQARKFASGEPFFYLGEVHKLSLVERSRPPLLLNEHFELSRDALPRAEEIFVKWYREAARRVITERVFICSRENNFSNTRIRVTSARTRWGSCNSTGGLNFTWRLVLAPMPIIDYVVLHELVHTQVNNHSRKFWNMVENIMPDYRLRYDWLKENGYLLTLF